MCAKCGADHQTSECNSTSVRCVNCAKTNGADCKHKADDSKCPSLAQEQEKMKITLATDRNMNDKNSMQCFVIKEAQHLLYELLYFGK